ncbi:MAG TPA: hypothetical protein PLL10_07250, partial [Elusimicrobiales bacterium]|nr:hypothetical protein [Elusimicrobiales bacterium]
MSINKKSIIFLLAALALWPPAANAGLFSSKHENPLAPAIALYEAAQYDQAAEQLKALSSKGLSSKDKQL